RTERIAHSNRRLRPIPDPKIAPFDTSLVGDRLIADLFSRDRVPHPSLAYRFGSGADPAPWSSASRCLPRGAAPPDLAFNSSRILRSFSWGSPSARAST